MLVKFKDTNEQKVFNNQSEVIEYMHQNSHDKDLSRNEYLKNYSKRNVLFENKDLRAYDEDLFFKDLIKLNHITIL